MMLQSGVAIEADPGTEQGDVESGGRARDPM